MNPLEDERWVRDLGNEVHEYVTRDADRRDREAVQRHRELLAAHRDGWKQVADALIKGCGMIVSAIQAHGRH